MSAGQARNQSPALDKLNFPYEHMLNPWAAAQMSKMIPTLQAEGYEVIRLSRA
jgi:hypothetical protein